MKRVVASVLVAVLACPSGWTCDCGEEPLPKIALEQAAAVFIGHVVSLRFEVRPNDGPYRHVIVCVFDDLEGFKGLSAHEREITVITPAQGTACGFPFRIDERYLVYARKRDSVLSTSVCLRTKPLVRYPTGDEFTLRSPDEPVDDRGLQEADLLRALLKK